MTKLAFDAEPSTRKHRLRLARYRYHVEVLARVLPDGPSVVLDAGCGRGRLPLYVKRWRPTAKRVQTVGFDLSPKRLDWAKTKGYDHLMKADLTQPWPFDDERFDVVICEQVLEHLVDGQPDFVLGEVHRVLKPGGIALVGVPIFPKLALIFLPAALHLRRYVNEHPGSHVQYFSLQRIQQLMGTHGLTPEQARGFRIFSLPMTWLEDFEWYYRFHQWFGRHVPSVCIEAVITGRKLARMTAVA